MIEENGINSCWIISNEIHSLFEILEAVIRKEIVICRNRNIADEYQHFIRRFPDEILEYFTKIVSEAACLKEIEEGGFDEDDFDEIKNTMLESKKIYLDVAKSLDNKIIVSTVEDKRCIYLDTLNKEITIKHGIACKCTWELWEEIKRRRQNVK
ncbi:hypothetical protein ACSAZL_11680 [Methanosarcina sp. T3]|uniref:hypothetical protein n=1 Tax=Methanosarcina sp. T3 TaxID=3439062 RepID=UPI003F834839